MMEMLYVCAVMLNTRNEACVTEVLHFKFFYFNLLIYDK